MGDKNNRKTVGDRDERSNNDGKFFLYLNLFTFAPRQTAKGEEMFNRGETTRRDAAPRRAVPVRSERGARKDFDSRAFYTTSCTP